MNWIKCSERMPPKKLWVLVYAPHFKSNRLFSAMHETRRLWVAFGHSPVSEPQEITHWQLMPEPPGVGE